MSKSKYNNPFTATFNGIMDLFRKQTPIGTLKDTDRLEGKKCLVTGANSGLGLATAQLLIDKGAFVVLACRSQIEETREKLLKKYSNEQFAIIHIDLTKIESINNFISELSNQKIIFDITIFNAAMVPSGSKKLANGLDEMFMVNYLSKFYLVNRILENNLIDKYNISPSRIIFISSESHRTNKAINISELGLFKEYSMGKVIELYGYYKLILNTFAQELSRRINNDNINIYALCPGPVNSNIARAAPKMMLPLLKVIFSIFFNSPEKAAQPVIYLSASKDIENRKQLYLHLMQEKAMDEKAMDIKNGTDLWNKSENLIQAII